MSDLSGLRVKICSQVVQEATRAPGKLACTRIELRPPWKANVGPYKVRLIDAFAYDKNAREGFVGQEENMAFFGWDKGHQRLVVRRRESVSLRWSSTRIKRQKKLRLPFAGMCDRFGRRF